MSKIKVGDRIRVYEQDLIDTGVVTKIDEQNIVYYISDQGKIDDTAHIKQCRKLLKKNTLRNRVDEVLKLCSSHLYSTWVINVVSILLNCEEKHAGQKLKEYLEKKKEK